MSLGRLEQILGPRGMNRQRWKEAGNWNNFCLSSGGLIDLLTPLGRWTDAEQRAGIIDIQPPMHLVRAHHLRHLAVPSAAWHDHAGVLAIAQRGNMRGYLAECALLAGHLHLGANEVLRAAAEHADAARLISVDACARREAPLQLLHACLLQQQSDPILSYVVY